MSSASVVEDALGVVRELVVELPGPVGGHHGDRALLAPEAALDVQRRPRALGLVLGDHERELAGVAERAAVEQPRHRAAHVAHDQAHGTADGEVGPPARPEEVVARVDVELTGDRAVDDHQHSRAAGRGARPVIAPARIADALDRGDHDRHVLRATAGHDRVDRHLLRRDVHRAVGDEGDLAVGLELRRLQHRPDPGLGGRDDRQPVRPAPSERQFDGLGLVAGRDALGRQGRSHRASSPWIAGHASTRCQRHATSRKA